MLTDRTRSGGREKKTQCAAIKRAGDKGEGERGVTVSGLCNLAGTSRQNFYKAKRHRQKREVEGEFILELVRSHRRLHPHIGGVKLLEMIRPILAEHDVSMGKHRFFDLLRENGLTVARKRKFARTTDSRHGFRVYGNLLKDMTLTAPGQAWVSDITYIRTNSGFVYLALVMDAYSRKIVGYHLGNTLEATGCMKALKMAIKQLKLGQLPIHHSDRGSQYCCGDYIKLLEGRKDKIKVSMTEENHCYENAQAERLNGILKQEYGLGETLRDIHQARKMTKQAVDLYNNLRPHRSLGLCKPSQVHDQNINRVEV